MALACFRSLLLILGLVVQLRTAESDAECLYRVVLLGLDVDGCCVGGDG